MERRQIPRLALQILKDHREIFAATQGMADPAVKAPVTERTSYWP